MKPRHTYRKRTRTRESNLCWIDHLRPIWGIKNPATAAVVLGLLADLVGVLPLFVSGQGELALGLPIVLAPIGISWSLLFYWLGSEQYRERLEAFSTALELRERTKYQHLAAAHIKRLRDDRNHFKASASLWLITVSLLTADFYGFLPGGLSRPLRVLPPDWYSAYLRPYRLATIWILGFPVVLLLWTLGRLIVLHILFLLRLGALKWLASQQICFLRFRPLLRINMLAAFGWSVGVALFGLAFRNDFSVGRVAFLGGLGTIAAMALLWPTWLLRDKLKKIGTERMNILVERARQKLEMASRDPTRWTEVFVLEDQMAKDLSLVVGWRYIGTVVTSFVIPVVAAVIGAIATKYI